MIRQLPLSGKKHTHRGLFGLYHIRVKKYVLSTEAGQKRADKTRGKMKATVTKREGEGDGPSSWDATPKHNTTYRRSIKVCSSCRRDYDGHARFAMAHDVVRSKRKRKARKSAESTSSSSCEDVRRLFQRCLHSVLYTTSRREHLSATTLQKRGV